MRGVAESWTTHRLLDGPIVFADVVHDSRDAERSNEAQQVSQDPEHDAEDERPAEGLPQGLPDPLWAWGGCALGPLGGGKRKGEILNTQFTVLRSSEMFCFLEGLDTALLFRG